MSSVQSAFAQVGPREKFLSVVRAPASGEAVTVKPTFTVSASMTATAFDAATTAATPAVAGSLYRDMGKTVNVYDPVTNLAVRRYVGAQLVAGAVSEGVAASPVLVYLLVWEANGDPANFARTG